MEELFKMIWPHLTTGGVTLLVAYFSLPSKLVENKLAKQLENFKAKHSKELEELKCNLSQHSVRLAKTQEKDVEMLEDIFKKLVPLHSALQDLMNPVGVGYNLDRQSPEQARKTLVKLQCSEDEIERVLEVTDRDYTLYNIQEHNKMKLASITGIDFQQTYAKFSPFLAKGLDAQIDELSLLTKQVFNAKSRERRFDGDTALKADIEAKDKLQKISDKIPELKQSIRKSLRLSNNELTDQFNGIQHILQVTC